MENPPPVDFDAAFFGSRCDLSPLVACVDVLALQLELFEPGCWWDMARCRRSITHPAVLEWFERYGFKNLHDLNRLALSALCSQLEKRLRQFETPPPMLPAPKN